MAVIALEGTGARDMLQRFAARLKPMATAAGKVIDSYVSYRMQTSASQADYIRRPASEMRPERPESSTTGGHDRSTYPLQPLDPGTISDVIPAFFVGRNRDGLWVARHAKDETGGIFLFRNSATAFARRHSGPAGCATIFPAGRFELELANSGNPLAGPIGWSIRLARRLWQSITPAFATTRRRRTKQGTGEHGQGRLASTVHLGNRPSVPMQERKTPPGAPTFLWQPPPCTIDTGRPISPVLPDGGQTY